MNKTLTPSSFCALVSSTGAMVWLRPIEAGAASVSAPPLDDVGAEQEQRAAAAKATLQRLVDERAAVRKAEHVRALGAVRHSSSLSLATMRPSAQQLYSMRPGPSPYLSGALAAKSGTEAAKVRRRRSKGGVEAELMPREMIGRAGPTAGEHISPPPPQPPHVHPPLPAAVSPPPRSRRSSLRSSTTEKRAASDPRSLSLVHLDSIPVTLSMPQLGAADMSLGAACSSAGLGSYGDAEMVDDYRTTDSTTHRARAHTLPPRRGLSRSATMPHERRDSWRTVTNPAPAHPPELTSTLSPNVPPPPFSSPPTTPAAAPAAVPAAASASCASRMSLLSHSRAGSVVLRLPTPGDLRRATSLDGLVPPEPTEALSRASAAEARAARHGVGAASVARLSAPPQRFSSIASRNASPLEFLASITDWSYRQAQRTPPEAPLRTRLSSLPSASRNGLEPLDGGMAGGGVSISNASLGECAPAHTTSRHSSAAAVQRRALFQSLQLASTPHGSASAAGPIGGALDVTMSRTATSTADSSVSMGSRRRQASAGITALDEPRLAPPGAGSCVDDLAAPPPWRESRPRQSREWVGLQAHIDAEMNASMHDLQSSSSTTTSAFRVASDATSHALFVKARPAPAPPSAKQGAHGVPWLGGAHGGARVATRSMAASSRE